jgi:hypothetical protein
LSQTALTTQKMKHNAVAVNAGDLAVTLAAMDAANGNSFVPTGREVLIFQNTDTVAHTITITSVADERGRLDTSLTNYSLPAGAVIAIEFLSITGWAVGIGGVVTMTTTSALVKVAVLQKN